jgi:hypothetical protein
MNNRLLIAKENDIDRESHPHRMNTLAGIYPKAFSNWKTSSTHQAQEAAVKGIGN